MHRKRQDDPAGSKALGAVIVEDVIGFPPGNVAADDAVPGLPFVIGTGEHDLVHVLRALDDKEHADVPVLHAEERNAHDIRDAEAGCGERHFRFRPGLALIRGTDRVKIRRRAVVVIAFKTAVDKQNLPVRKAEERTLRIPLISALRAK